MNLSPPTPQSNATRSRSAIAPRPRKACTYVWISQVTRLSGKIDAQTGRRGDQATIHARDGRAVSAVEAAAGVQGRASGNRGRGASPFCATGKMAGGGDIDRNGWMVGGMDGLAFGSGGGRMGQKRERENGR